MFNSLHLLVLLHHVVKPLFVLCEAFPKVHHRWCEAVLGEKTCFAQGEGAHGVGDVAGHQGFVRLVTIR